MMKLSSGTRVFLLIDASDEEAFYLEEPNQRQSMIIQLYDFTQKEIRPITIKKKILE